MTRNRPLRSPWLRSDGAILPFGNVAETVEMRGPKAKKRLPIEPSEALMVQQIFRMKRVGIGQGPTGHKNIVCHLNASGATLRGRKWHVSNVREVLTRSTCRGKHLYGVHDVRNGIKRPEHEWQTIDAPVIIPEAERLEVQAGIARNSRHITPPTFVSGPTMLATPNAAMPSPSPRARVDAIATVAARAGCVVAKPRTQARAFGTRSWKRSSSTPWPTGSCGPSACMSSPPTCSTTVRPPSCERQAHPKALRTERTRVEGAIQNMFDFIEQGIVSARDTDSSARIASHRTRRADLEQEFRQVERQLSAVDRRVNQQAVERLGEGILDKLRSREPTVRQGYARRFIAKLVVAPDLIPITGPVKPLKIAASGDPEQVAPAVSSPDRKWCRLQDSNL